MRLRAAGLVCLSALVAGCSIVARPGHRTFQTALPAAGRASALTVVVVDGTAIVTSVEPGVVVIGKNPVDVVPGANAITVKWTGGECDRQATLTLDRAEISYGIRLHTELQPGSFNCSQVGIERAVRLNLNQFIPSGSFGLAIDP